MRKEIKRMVVVTVASLSGLSMTACSTTSGASPVGAPIVYKADQSHFKQASTTQSYKAPKSYTTPKHLQPRASVPTPSAPKLVAKPLPKPVATNPGIDKSKVDTTLYAHQKVGKQYRVHGKTYTPKHEPNYDKTGVAARYSDKYHGKLTASGEVYNMNALTAAHRTLPMNSMLYVINQDNGQGVMVRVNDRGPFEGNRIIDLSRKAASQLGVTDGGVVNVRVQYAGPADPAAIPHSKPVTAESTPAPKVQPLAESQNYQSLRALPKAAKPVIPMPKAEAPAPETYAQAAPQRALPTPETEARASEAAKPAPQPVAPKAQVGETAPTLPQAEPVVPFEAPHNSNPLLEGYPLSEHQSTEPETPHIDNNAPMSLTIKGPVHLAGSKMTKEESEANVYEGGNVRKIKAKNKHK